MAKKVLLPMDEIRALPARMKYARTELAGLTLTSLAERTGVNLSQLSRIESGKGSDGIEATTAVRIARGLGQPVGWLLAGEGLPYRVPVIRQMDRRRRDLGRKLRDEPKGPPTPPPVPRNTRGR